MKLRDVMKPFPPTVEMTDAVGLAAQMMLWSGVHVLPVTEEGELVGTITDHAVALYQARAGERVANEHSVATVVELDPPVAGPDDDVAQVARRMAEHDLAAVTVAVRGHVVGVVTTRDLLRAQVRAGLERQSASAGNGGSDISLTVGDVMTPDPICVAADDSLMDAAARMQRYRVRHLPVVDGDHCASGMLSDRDVRSALGDPLWVLDLDEIDDELEELRVSDVMGSPAIVVSPHESCTAIAHAFADFAVSAVPVVDADGRVIGMLSYVDLLRGLAGGQAGRPRWPLHAARV